MTRKKLQLNILAVILIYAAFIVIGSIIYFIQPDDHNKYFNVFKDLILLFVAIPAAYLGDCFQRRSAFTTSLRELWANLIESVNQARQYTFETNPDQIKYGQTLKALSKSIDEVRGVYCNVDIKKDSRGIGVYPFESLKEIQELVSQLGFEKYDHLNANKTRGLIEHHWTLIKSSFLFEFDRPTPTFVNTPYGNSAKYNHWKNPS